MRARRVFVIWIHPLFQESVRLLLNHPQVEWLGSTSDYESAPDQIMALQPDTILIEEDPLDTSKNFELVGLIEATDWELRFISLNLDDNHLKIVHYEQGLVGQAGDLLHLVLKE
jgi:DNA-binding NarL/FixJ family response regulator